MKKHPSQKKRTARRGLWVLVLLALLVLSGYNFLPSQSLRRIETTIAIPPTHVLATERVGGQFRYLSVNENVLLYSAHQFSPFEGWISYDLSPIPLAEGSPVCAHGVREEGRRSQIFGVVTQKEAVTVQIYRSDMLAARRTSILRAEDGTRYFWLRWEEDDGVYPTLLLLDENENILGRYDLLWDLIQH